MRVLLQRVSRAAVAVDGAEVGAVGRGFLALVGVTHEDDAAAARKLAAKTARLRVFADDAGLMNLALGDVGGAVLAVSQFTLYADTRGETAPASPAPPDRSTDRPSTRPTWRRCAPRASRSRPGSSARTCTWTWSTTGR